MTRVADLLMLLIDSFSCSFCGRWLIVRPIDTHLGFLHPAAGIQALHPSKYGYQRGSGRHRDGRDA
jgi:hypothetical protein